MTEFEVTRRRHGPPLGAAAPGRPLEATVRSALEAGLGHDFAHVRVHAGAAAAEAVQRHGAAAVTTGSDIAFAVGRYRPQTRAGFRLLAHELAHVVQDDDSGSGPARVSESTDRAETQADLTAAAVGWGDLAGAYPSVSRESEAAPGRLPAPAVPALTGAPALLSRVQLTYDDGPDSEGNTRRVLAALNAARARATFYLVGARVRQGDNWRVVFDMAAGGHWLGNHAFDWNDKTNDHIFLTGGVPDQAAKILETEHAIREALVRGRDDAVQKGSWKSIPPASQAYIGDVIARGTGRFRTPGFRSDPETEHGARTMPALTAVNEVLAANGLRTLAITNVPSRRRVRGATVKRQVEGVTVDPQDWKKGRTKSQIADAVLDKTASNQDSILVHSRIRATADATPRILAGLKERSFTFDPTVRGEPPRADPAAARSAAAQVAKARGALRAKHLELGPDESGRRAIDILQLAQQAGPQEAESFLAELHTTRVATEGGEESMVDWMAVNPQWRLFRDLTRRWRPDQGAAQ